MTGLKGRNFLHEHCVLYWYKWYWSTIVDMLTMSATLMMLMMNEDEDNGGGHSGESDSGQSRIMHN